MPTRAKVKGDCVPDCTGLLWDMGMPTLMLNFNKSKATDDQSGSRQEHKRITKVGTQAYRVIRECIKG